MLQEYRTQTAYHLALFPNTFFSLYPDAIFRIVISPQVDVTVSNGKCKLKLHLPHRHFAAGSAGGSSR